MPFPFSKRQGEYLSDPTDPRDPSPSSTRFPSVASFFNPGGPEVRCDIFFEPAAEENFPVLSDPLALVFSSRRASRAGPRLRGRRLPGVSRGAARRSLGFPSSERSPFSGPLILFARQTSFPRAPSFCPRTRTPCTTTARGWPPACSARATPFLLPPRPSWRGPWSKGNRRAGRSLRQIAFERLRPNVAPF